MRFPNRIRVEQDGCHRLIPSRYSEGGGPILNLLAEDNGDLLRDLTELEGATNNRLLGESGKLSDITTIELVSGFNLAHVVNASFTYGRPDGGRFNIAGRGAWYAAFEMDTAQAEVAFHKASELKEIGWTSEETSEYIDYLADFKYEFHDLQNDPAFEDCLAPDSYTASQALGDALLRGGSAGIVYPSVRRSNGVCIACFRPPLVLNVRSGPKVTYTFIDIELKSVV
jgi:RES domain-containing protein